MNLFYVFIGLFLLSACADHSNEKVEGFEFTPASAQSPEQTTTPPEPDVDTGLTDACDDATLLEPTNLSDDELEGFIPLIQVRPPRVDVDQFEWICFGPPFFEQNVKLKIAPDGAKQSYELRDGVVLDVNRADSARQAVFLFTVPSAGDEKFADKYHEPWRTWFLAVHRSEIKRFFMAFSENGDFYVDFERDVRTVGAWDQDWIWGLELPDN